MTKQIDELVALADEYANRKQWTSTQSAEEKRQELRTALEAALKPVEPVTWAEAEAITIRPSVEDTIEVFLEDQTLDNATGMVMAVLNAAHQAQTPEGQAK